MNLVLISYTGLSFPKTRNFEKFGKKYALLSTLSNKRHCWILQLHFRFKNYQISDRNWFFHELLRSFLVALCYLFQKQEHLKNFARSKLFYPPYLIRGIAASYSSTSKLKIIKWMTNWFMQELFWSFIC